EPRLSPDGSRVVLTRDGDIWVYELAGGRSNKITTDAASMMAGWKPNRSQLADSSARKRNLEAGGQPSDRNGEPRQLTNLGGQVHVDAWSPDGRILTVHHHPIEGSVAIYTVAMEAPDPKPQLFFKASFNAEGADFSPDQRYVSYLSEKTRQREVYIRPY